MINWISTKDRLPEHCNDILYVEKDAVSVLLGNFESVKQGAGIYIKCFVPNFDSSYYSRPEQVAYWAEINLPETNNTGEIK